MVDVQAVISASVDSGRPAHLVAHFVDAVTGVAPLAVRGSDGLRAVEVVESVRGGTPPVAGAGRS